MLFFVNCVSYSKAKLKKFVYLKFRILSSILQNNVTCKFKPNKFDLFVSYSILKFVYSFVSVCIKWKVAEIN